MLCVGAYEPLGNAVVLMVDQAKYAVILVGKGTVEKVVRKWVVQVEFVPLKGKPADVVMDVAAGPSLEVSLVGGLAVLEGGLDVNVNAAVVTSLAELELAKDEGDEEGEEEDVVGVEVAEVFAAPAAVSLVNEEVIVLFGKEANESVGMEREMLFAELEEFRERVLGISVGTAKFGEAWVNESDGMDDVPAGNTEVKFVTVDDKMGTVVADKAMELDVVEIKDV